MKKRMTTSASLREGPIFLLFHFYYARVNSVHPYSILNCSPLGKHHVVAKDRGTYIQLDVGNHELLLLTLSSREISWEVKTINPHLHMCLTETFAPKNMP